MGKVDGGYGTLNSSSNSNIFTMKLDKAGILQRAPIETVATFMHEAIHAEMRRYLYGATDTSSLPGFPGNFTHDWKLYVKEFYGNNVEPAEHEAMAVKYRDIIVNSLKEYDSSELTTEEYEALAWHGLSNTRYYKDVLSDQEKQAIVDNRESALNKTTDSCN